MKSFGQVVGGCVAGLFLASAANSCGPSSTGASPAVAPNYQRLDFDGGVAGQETAARDGGSNYVCHSPTEPGCSKCCVATDAPGHCSRRSWTGMPAGDARPVTPWFNATEALAGSCPSDCPACARCSHRDEQELLALPDRPDCACSTLTNPVDPCYAPKSCECHCSRLTRLRAACGK